MEYFSRPSNQHSVAWLPSTHQPIDNGIQMFFGTSHLHLVLFFISFTGLHNNQVQSLVFFFLSFCVLKGDPSTPVRVDGSRKKIDGYDIATGVNYGITLFFIWSKSTCNPKTDKLYSIIKPMWEGPLDRTPFMLIPIQKDELILTLSCVLPIL